MTRRIISNEEMSYIMKIVKSVKESGLVIKSIGKTIKNDAKGQKVRFLSMSLHTLHPSWLGNLLIGKSRIIADEGTIRPGYNFSWSKTSFLN